MSKSLNLLRQSLQNIFTDRDLNQSGLARLMGVLPSKVNKFFVEERDFQISNLDKIAEALKIEPYELLLPKQPKESPTVSTLSKLIEQQSKMLDGNEELLELWSKIDQDTKEVLMKQIRNFAQVNELKKPKSKA